jgi:hypothetical protein
MARVQLVAESFEEYTNPQLNEEAKEELSPINEGLQGSIRKFLKDPKKYEQKFPLFFKDQLKKFPDAVPSVKSLSLEEKVALMKKSLEHLKAKPGLDKLQLPLVKTTDGKIKVKVEGNISGKGTASKAGIHKQTGVD